MATIKRILQSEITARMKPQKVMLIYGARRVGKTILLKDIVSSFRGKKLMLNGESGDTVDMLATKTIDNYRRLFGGIGLLAIDEAQHIPDIGMKLKLMVDEIPGIRLLVSGSSSFDLSNSAGEPLVGRHSQFMLTPLSIEEISHYESGGETVAKNEGRVIYGLYPELVGLETNKEKQEYLNDIVDSYLLRDILTFESLKNSQKLRDLLKLIAWQVGSEVSTESLGRQLGLSRNTVERYLDLLQKVFILFRVGGYSRNLRKEVTKSCKWYFLDTGIRNAIIRDFRPFNGRHPDDIGALWENYIIAERMKHSFNHRTDMHPYFWRTYDQQEIDFIEEHGTEIRAFEIKAGKSTPKPPKAFAEAYPDVPFNVINAGNYLDYVL